MGLVSRAARVLAPSRCRHTLRDLAALALALGLLACTRDLARIQEPPEAAAVTTGGPWVSMIYASRTDAGVILVDLGWDGSGRAVRQAVGKVGARPRDVVAVFLTHGHRDHIAGWRAVQHATFYVERSEADYLEGEAEYSDAGSRFARFFRRPDRPEPEQLDIRTFTGDTTFVFGQDTVFAFHVPGHTPGSTAFLVRHALFIGDAVTHSPIFGFQPARAAFTDDHATAVESLVSLRRRLAPFDVRHVCTAHAKCAPADDAFWEQVLGKLPSPGSGAHRRDPPADQSAHRRAALPVDAGHAAGHPVGGTVAP